MIAPPPDLSAGVPRAAAEPSERTRRRRRKAPIAAFLSFLVPGAGQLYNHQRRLAAVFAVPVLLALAVAAFVLLGDGSAVLTSLLDVRVIIALVVANGVLLVWRLTSMLQAHRFRARFRPRRIGTWITGALVVLTLLMHAVPAFYALKLVDTLSTVALGGERGVSDAARSRFPGFAPPPDAPATPATPPPSVEEGERINVLLVGIDSGPGRDHSLIIRESPIHELR